MLLLILAIITIVGGRKWHVARQARRAVDRLSDPDVRPEQVEEVGRGGREGIVELFRLLGTAPAPEVRRAAGRALAHLWARDQLIAEEEKAIVTRGLDVQWRMRRRYPRALTCPIPIEILAHIPFLDPAGPGVRPGQLEWSWRVVGAQRADLETFSPWRPGPPRIRFALEPADFRENGPHRLALQLRVRTRGLTSTWEHDLPHQALTFEFDPALKVESLLALPDEGRAELLARSIRLGEAPSGDAPRLLDLDERWTLKDPPTIAVREALPCDLAHRVLLEIEGVPDHLPAGTLIVTQDQQVDGERRFALGPVAPRPLDQLKAAGRVRLRVRLEADANLGWAEPDVRSVWPRSIVTDWREVLLLRRG